MRSTPIPFGEAALESATFSVEVPLGASPTETEQVRVEVKPKPVVLTLADVERAQSEAQERVNEAREKVAALKAENVEVSARADEIALGLQDVNVKLALNEAPTKNENARQKLEQEKATVGARLQGFESLIAKATADLEVEQAKLNEANQTLAAAKYQEGRTAALEDVESKSAAFLAAYLTACEKLADLSEASCAAERFGVRRRYCLGAHLHLPLNVTAGGLGQSLANARKLSLSNPGGLEHFSLIPGRSLDGAKS